ncbi:MAG TPA: caspase family protein, partial [Pirellulales bacterium]
DLIADTSKYLVKAVRDWLPPHRTHFGLLTGKDATPARVLDWLAEAQPGPNDSIFVYFCGHGANDPGEGGVGQVFKLHGELLPRRDVLAAMGVRDGKATRVRAAVLVSDCCGRYEAVAQAPTKSAEPRDRVEPVPAAPRLGPDPDLHRYLFFRCRGVVDVTSARLASDERDVRGTVAMIYDKEEEGFLPPGVKVGAAFSFQFRQALFGLNSDAFQDETGAACWSKFIDAVSLNTEAYVKRNGADPEAGVQKIAAPTLDAPSQGGPIAKSPLGYRFGVTFEDSAGAVVVREVIVDTPAEWMGFQTGDVIEKAFLFRDFKGRESAFEGRLDLYAKSAPALRRARALADLIDAAPDSEQEGGEWLVCQVRSPSGQKPRFLRVKLNPAAAKS